mgnify:CR=1 FL=1
MISHFLTVSDFYKEIFGCKVYKLALDIGGTCPNRDGTKGFGGCIFCSEGGSGEFAEKIIFSDSPIDSVITDSAVKNANSVITDSAVKNAIEHAKERVIQKCPRGSNAKFIAYFQSFTNTYEANEGDFEKLSSVFSSVIIQKEIVGIAIATRPDCLSDKMISFLQDLSERSFIQLEFGLQTSNDKTAISINRCYQTKTYDDTLERVKKIAPKIHIVTHIIFGLPGENKKDMMESVHHAVQCGTNGIKITCLHILKGTKLGKEYEEGTLKEPTFHALEMEEYFALLENALEIIPHDVVIHRLTGDGDKKLLLAPMWTRNKKKVLNSMKKM